MYAVRRTAQEVLCAQGCDKLTQAARSPHTAKRIRRTYTEKRVAPLICVRSVSLARKEP